MKPEKKKAEERQKMQDRKELVATDDSPTGAIENNSLATINNNSSCSPTTTMPGVISIHHHTVPSSSSSSASSLALPLRFLFELFAVSFSYALLYMTLSNVVIPKEVEKLADSSQTTWVGVIVGSGALSQLVTPVVGALSDRAGVREPYLKSGTAIILFGIGVLFLATQLKMLVLVFVAYLALSVGLSTIYAISGTLLSDNIAEEQMALASAVMAVLGMIGASTGYAFFALGFNSDATISILYTFVSLLGFAVTHRALTTLKNPLLSRVMGEKGNNSIIDEMNNSSSNINHALAMSGNEGGLVTSGSLTTAAAAAAATGTGNGVAAAAASGSSSGTGGTGGGVSNNNGESNSLTEINTANKGEDDADGKQPSRKQHAVSSHVKKYCEVVIHALTFPSPTSYPDFSLACASRCFFNSGLALQTFMLFFFRDVAAKGAGSGSGSGSGSGAAVVVVVDLQPPDRMVSRLAVLALLGGLLGAIPAGMLADRFGQKVVISIASFICICAMISFPILTGTSTAYVFDISGLLFGVGNSAFLVVDYGLGVRSLPKSKDGRGKPMDAAKDLGIFSLSATLGNLIGQLMFAGILERFSTHVAAASVAGAPQHAAAVRYEARGFNFCFSLASAFFAISAFCACLIKTK